MKENIDYRNDSRLSILNVADKCNISYKQEGKRFTAICPFCGANMGHFYLTPDDGKYYNVYRCVKCSKNGSALELYAELHNCSTTDAFKELIGYQVQSSVINDINKTTKIKNIKLHELSPIEERNKVYRSLLSNLTLSNQHFENLYNRGLTKIEITKNLYKTLPQDKNLKKSICRKMIKQRLNLKGIPGFYTDYYGDFTFWTPKEGGFLVPVIDYLGKIQGCQIRKDGTSKKKYPWFSSSYMENGCQANGFMHVHWNNSHSSDKVIITEGPLKATIASILSDTTFVAVPGTNGFKGIEYVLNTMHAKKLFIAYDMDKLENVYVMNALNNLVDYLKNNGFSDVNISDWNRNFKGIDNYLQHIKKDNNIPLT